MDWKAYRRMCPNCAHILPYLQSTYEAGFKMPKVRTCGSTLAFSEGGFFLKFVMGYGNEKATPKAWPG